MSLLRSVMEGAIKFDYGNNEATVGNTSLIGVDFLSFTPNSKRSRR